MPIRIPALLTLSLGFMAVLSPMAKETPVQSGQQESFYVAGYSARTNNAREMSGQGEIGKLWQNFTQQNLIARIPDRADPAALIVVYSDYAGDEKGDYTYTLGARVSSIEHLPAGMTWRKVVAGPYAVFVTDKGPVTQVVPAAWQKIWATSPEQMGGKRAFVTDFEVYDQRSADPQNAQVEIHIGLKPLRRGRPCKEA